MREIEAQAAEAEERQLAKEREAAERRLAWEAAMETAKRRLLHDHKLEVLRTRAAAWREAEVIRAYCDAIEQRYGAEAIAADPAAQRWLDFARD
jgi:hypothetical protein